MADKSNPGVKIVGPVFKSGKEYVDSFDFPAQKKLSMPFKQFSNKMKPSEDGVNLHSQESQRSKSSNPGFALGVLKTERSSSKRNPNQITVTAIGPCLVGGGTTRANSPRKALLHDISLVNDTDAIREDETDQ
jgi:hypothetical protein